MSRQIEAKTVRKICTSGIKFFSYLEKFFSPRWPLFYKGLTMRLIGLSMLTSGLALCLPLPPVILFSNSFPAWSVILLCLGILERDGLFILLGHVLAVATWLYFALWWEAIQLAFKNLVGYFT